MQVRWGRKEQHRVHGAGCACHTPLLVQINRRLSVGLSRRAVLRGIVSALAASSLGTARRACAAEPARPILFTNARIFNGRSSGLRQGTSVLVSGSKIEGLLPASQNVANAQIIDCRGRVLMPGLIDAHWHAILAGISQIVAMTADVPYVHLVAAQEAGRTLMRGFTTVRDVSGPAFALKRAIDEHLVAGPRIFPSGAMISQTSGHGDFRMRSELPRTALTDLSAAEAGGISALADGVAEVLRRTREQLMLGASQIKIMAGGGVSSLYDPLDSAQFTAAEIRAAVDAASDWGTYVCAHVYMSEGIQRAIANGVKCIEHGQLADEETVRKMADAGTWWSLQPFLADEDANPKASKEQQEQQRAIAEGTVRAFELGKKHNVKMAWGTDILFDPGKTGTQGKQLVKVARWFDNSEVLQLATSRNAKLLGLSGPRNPYPGALGVIEAGALADILVIDGNPLEDITLIADPEKNLKLIMKDGRIYKDVMSA
jgi:imidazolonepropionase-like amidohydrolase